MTGMAILTIGLVASIPVIALFEYYFFKRITKCECGQESPIGHYYILAFIEIFLFLAGVGFATLLSS